MRFLYLYLFFFVVKMSYGQDFWMQKDSINGPPRSGIATFVLGNRGFAVGGLIGNESSRKMYSYSVTQNDWDDEVSLGGVTGGGLERNLACGFSQNNKGYIATGEGLGTPFMKDVWEYDKVTQTWAQKADFPGSPRRGSVVFVINDYAYMGTGEDENGLCNDFYRYHAANNVWEVIAPFPGGARRQAIAFELNGYGWLATGDAGILKKDLWSYNVVTNQWQQKAELPGSARLGAVSWSTSPSAYIATGQSPEGEYLDDVWQYNYYQNTWIQKGPFLGGGRVNACSFVVNGIPFVGAGYNGQLLDDFYAYQGLAAVHEASKLLQLYPNPTRDVIHVKSICNPIAYQLMSMDGRLIEEQRELLGEFISLENLISGTYMINFIFSDHTLVRCVQKH